MRLGELLVESQIITRAQLEEILELQRRDGRRLGTLLVEAGVVTETQVTQILSQQLSVPWVSLYHIDFSRQLLNLVSQEIAEKYCLVPIFVRRVRGLGETLYIAMDDPSDENAQREVSQYSGLPVRAMIAPPSDIRAAIRVYYGIGKETASLSEAVAEVAAEEARAPGRAGPPPAPSTLAASAGAGRAAATTGGGAAPTETPVASASPVPTPAVVPPPAESSVPPIPREGAVPVISEPPDSGPQIEAREITMPPPKRGRPRRMVTLTLLDGTKVNLPARLPKEPSNPPTRDTSELTARDLIAALRAMSHGADASEIVGNDARWETLFAALLSLLLKKHLIADWEFVEELKKV